MHSKRLVQISFLLALVGMLALYVFPLPIVHAASIIVTTTSNGVGGANCTLRDAITAANTDTATGACSAGSGADTIILAASSTYTLSVVDNTDPTLGPNGLPVISSPITINGNGSAIVRDTSGGTLDFRIFQVGATGALTLSNVRVGNGSATSTYLGGGIYNNGAVTVINGTFFGNSSTNNGGGVFNNTGASLTITSSTFVTNTALNGGGIYNWGTVSIANSTFSGNSASFGGAINNGNNTVTVLNSTFAGNSATTQGGSFYNSSGSVVLKNTIVANSPSSANCGGSISDGGNNLQFGGTTANSCGTSIRVGDPRLGVLANNGGSTQTLAPQSGSLALEAGNSTICASAPVSGVDQRGSTRPAPAGTSCDIGAFESALRPPPTITIAFAPTLFSPGQVSTLIYNIANPNSTGAGLTGVGITNNLPAGLLVASSPNVSNNCGGAVTATPGSGTISLTGGTLTPGAVCTVKVNVTADVVGTFTNTTGPISSTESGTGSPSNSASVTVIWLIFQPELFRPSATATPAP